jgi:hypothetical protein
VNSDWPLLSCIVTTSRYAPFSFVGIDFASAKKNIFLGSLCYWILLLQKKAYFRFQTFLVSLLMHLVNAFSSP